MHAQNYIDCAFTFFMQIFVINKKLFSLEFIDNGFKRLNLRSFDGEKPSTLIGVNLTSTDSNLHQHGIYNILQMFTHITMLPLL